MLCKLLTRAISGLLVIVSLILRFFNFARKVANYLMLNYSRFIFIINSVRLLVTFSRQFLRTNNKFAGTVITWLCDVRRSSFIFREAILRKAKAGSVTEGVSVSYRPRYFPIKSSSGQSNVSSKRVRGVSIGRVLLWDRLIYSQTLSDRKGAYYCSVYDAQPDLGEVVDVLEDSNMTMTVVHIDKCEVSCLISINLRYHPSSSHSSIRSTFPIKF